MKKKRDKKAEDILKKQKVRQDIVNVGKQEDEDFNSIIRNHKDTVFRMLYSDPGEFLIKNKAEAIQMSIFEYDEELHKRTLLEEGYEKGMAEGKAEDILELLEELGEIPEEVRQKILSEMNLEILRKWLKMAAKAESIEQFLSNMQP